MKAQRKLIFLAIITSMFYISCSEKKNTQEKSNIIGYAIDTTVQFNNGKIKITVECKEDCKSIANNITRDWVDNGIYNSEDGYYSFKSHEFLVSIENEKGKKNASINLDLLSAMSIGNKLQNKIGSLKELILTKEISFLGITPKGVSMFKVSTWDGDESGGEWTIGVYTGENAIGTPCLLMGYDNPVGEDVHYKNNSFFN